MAIAINRVPNAPMGYITTNMWLFILDVKRLFHIILDNC
jgi:hypothetical protein